MVRKIVIVVLSLGFCITGLSGIVGQLQAYLDPGRFYNASDRPYLYCLQGEFRLNVRLQFMVNSYRRGSLAVEYSSLPTRGWFSSTAQTISLPGCSIYTVQRCPIQLSSSSGPPPGTLYQQAGWIIVTPLLFIAFLFGLYPAIAFVRGPLRRSRRRRKGLCVGCAYDLTGNVSGTCPECGTEVKKP